MLYGGKMSEMLILHVEDDPVQAEVWELHFRQAGYQVITAGSVEQALDAIDKRYFHVAVIDQSFNPETPGKDTLGVDIVARHLKQQIDSQVMPVVPCIILTAYAEYEPLKQAYGDLGVFAYISKNDADAGPQLLRKVAEAFETKIRCNFELEVRYHSGLSLDKMVEDLRLKGVDLAGPEIKATINKEMRDLLGKLFHDCSRVEIFPLASGYGGAGVVMVLPYQLIDGIERQSPYELIKYGDVARIRREAENYDNYSVGFQQTRRPSRLEVIRTKHLGGVRYTYLGVPLEKARDFHSIYQEQKGTLDEQTHHISSILDDLFMVAFDLWYGQPGPKHPINFKDQYADRLFAITELQANFEATFPDWRSKQRIRFPELGSQEFRTFVYDLPDLPVRPIVGYDRVVTHGDLNGRNILVYDNKAWLVDFYQTGPGHIFRDFVKLESYIKFHLMETENLEALSLFEDTLNVPDPSPDNTAFAIWKNPDDLIKAYRIILKLRDWACVKALETSWSQIRDEYYTGLFYQTLAVLGYSVKVVSKKHALVSANKIYDLLTS
jgi:CheY-like chemotaxis protein